MNEEQQKADAEYKRQVKEKLADLTQLLSKSDVSSMICAFKIGENNYSCMFGDVVEITKLLIDARNGSEIFDSILDIQAQVQEEMNIELALFALNSKNINPSVN